MKMRSLATAIVSLTLLLVPTLSTAQTGARPNFLVILTDDQGYGDLSLHGNQDLDTPRLDALGRESLRFTNYFVHSVCAPTRASLMTGRHFNRVSVWGVHEGRDHLLRSVPTLAETLRAAGYHTTMVGKWHMGMNPGHRPWERGFVDALAGTNYNNQTPVYRVQSPEGGVALRGRSTEDMLTREALNFLDERPNDRPFFAYVAYNAPHHAWVGPEDLVKKYLAMGLAEPTANCYAEIESLDRAIGDLLDGLAERDLADDTIVVFFSDNGPHQSPIPDADWERRNPQGFRGQKGSLFDNGHRVPLFVRIPGVETREIDALAGVADWMPTLLELAGVESGTWPEGLEGRSLVPLLTGRDTLPNRRMIDTHFNPTWDDRGRTREPVLAELNFNPQGLWIRDGRYKFIQDRRGQHLLFDTQNDPREQTDIKADHPELVESFLGDLRTWWAETLQSPEVFEKADIIIGHEGEESATFRTITFPEWRGDVGGWYRHENFDSEGDGFAGEVIVATPGAYRVSLHCSRQGHQLGVRLRIGESVLEDTIRFGQGDLDLGVIHLSEAGAFPLEFVLTDTSDGSIPELYLMTFQRESAQ